MEALLLFANFTLEDVLESPPSIVSSLIGDLPSLDETFVEALDSSSELSLLRLLPSHFIMDMEFLPHATLDIFLPKGRYVVCHH